MTSALHDPRPSNRALMLVGHYSWVFMVALVATNLAEVCTGHRYWGLNLAGDLLMASWFSALWLVDRRYHEARLCERCIAATPLNPQASVDRWRRFLRLEHSTGAQTAVFLGILALDVWLVLRHSRLSSFSDLLVVSLVALMYGAEYIHRRLYPWCPWCDDWGDGGDHEVSPDVPDPAVSR